MKNYTLYGRVVTPAGIIEDGALSVSGGRITAVGRRFDVALSGELHDFGSELIAPGFVDIHCHAAGNTSASDNPCEVADYHRSHGTTSMLLTFYRRLWFEQAAAAVEATKKAMKTRKNIVGVHMEGPYLNPSHGAGSGMDFPVLREEYMRIAESGIVKQWTFAPEHCGMEVFLSDIKSCGIIPAIGHSAASPEQVRWAVDNGAKIITHLFCATGASVEPTRYAGTKEVDFSFAALLSDGVFYEIINDREGIHVRHDLIKLAIKTAGLDSIVAITDSSKAPFSDETDVNLDSGELRGSRLTMQGVAKNFLALGLSVSEVFRVASLNPAAAIGIDGEVGSLAVGKRADIIITDDKFEKVKICEGVF